MTRIWALLPPVRLGPRLEKQPTDLRQNTSYFGDRTLGVAAGANVLVAGSAIFGADDGVVAAMKRLRDAIGQVSN
jgi:hypothetical protein